MREYEPMWTTNAEDYILVSTEPETELSVERAAIVNQKTRMLEGIEENEVYLEVKRRMVAAGVRVVRLEEVRHLFEPDHTESDSGGKK